MIANDFLRRPWTLLLAAVVLTGTSDVDTCPAQLQGTIPSLSFERAIETLYEGHFRRAERAFRSELRSAVKTVQSRWVDSICYHAMLGELAFQQGKFDVALQQFDQACQLQLAFPKWLLKVQFGTVPLRADTNRARRIAPWGPGQRQVVLVNLPRSLPVMQGHVTTEQDLRRQGPTVVSPLQLWKVDVVEVIRCSSLAIRRRNQLLGPLARHDRVTRQLAAALARGGAPPNHWSNAWIDLQLGLAYAGQGEIEQALTRLNRATLLAGQYDHPLTCVALLEQGRLALLGGNAEAAARLFSEASLSAFAFEDWGVVSEAIQLLQESQLARQQPAAPASLELALAWARQNRFDHMIVNWSIALSESLVAAGQADAAEATLREAFARLGEMRTGLAGSRYNYALALAHFGQQRAADGNKTLTQAVASQRVMSPWNYQISLTTSRYDNGQLSQRDATKLYGELLRDPGPMDWALRAHDALTYLATSHSVAFDRWFLATLQRGDIPAALVVADLAKRHRFHASLPWGGRLFGLRMLLEAPQQALNAQALLQRQELLLRYPAYQGLSTEGRALRSQLTAEISNVEPDRLEPALVKKYRALDRNIEARESILQTIAVRREPATIVFPPQRSLGEVQSRLEPGQALVVFHTADNQTHGFLITSVGTTQWILPPRAQLQRKVAGFLRDLGNYEANRPLTIKEATDDAWQTSGATLWGLLFGKSRRFPPL